MSEGRASKLRPGSALVGPRFSLMDLSTSPTTETDMQTTQTPHRPAIPAGRINPADLIPGVALASPDPEQPRVVVEVRTAHGVRFMLGDQHGWHWRADRLAVALETHGYEVAA